MSFDAATLGITINADGAIQTTQKLSAGLDASAASATKLTAAQKDLIARSEQLATASLSVDVQNRQAVASFLQEAAAIRASAQQMGVFAEVEALTAKAVAETGSVIAAETAQLKAMRAELAATAAAQAGAGGAAESHGLQLGRLRMELGTLVSRVTGTNSALDRMGGALGSMAIGNPAIIGVMAAIAAIGAGYEYLTKEAHDAAKQQEEYLQSLREEIKKTRDAMGDMTLAAAKANVENAEIALASAQSAGAGSGPDGGVDPLFAKRIAAKKRELEAANELLAAAQQKKTEIDHKTLVESEKDYTDNLAMLVQHNQATQEERQRALDLYRKNGEEIAALAKSQTDNVRRAQLIGENDTLKSALFPDDKEAKKALAAAETTRREYEKLAQIANDNAAKVMAETAAMHEQTQARLTSTAALEAWRVAHAGEMAALTEEIKFRELAAKKLQEHQTITAAELATAQQSVANSKAAAEAKEREAIAGEHLIAAHETAQAITARLTALAQETDTLNRQTVAMQQGKEASDALAVTLAGEKAVREAWNDAVAKGQTLSVLEIGAITAVAEAHARATIANTDASKALKEGTKDSAAFAKEQQRIADILRHDVASAINELTSHGLQSFDAFFSSIGRLAVRMTEQVTGEIEKLQAELEKATTQDAVVKITQQIEQLQKLQMVGAVVGGGITGGMTGYQVGQQSGSAALGILGGAASGALAGAAGGPVGIAVGALAGLTGGLLGAAAAAHEAAVHMAELSKAATDSIDSFRAGIEGNSVDAQIATLHAQADAIRKQINDAQAAGARGIDSYAADRLEEEGKAKIYAAFALSQQRLQEDYKARELAAQGHVAEADALSFATKQQREYEDAVKASADATTLAALAAAQEAERIQRAAQIEQARQRSEEDAQIRLERARGDASAEADARAATNRREIEDLVAAGASAATIELTKLAQAAEDAATAAAKAAAEQEKLASQQKAYEDLNVEFLRTSGQTKEADDLAFQLDQQRRLEDAQKNQSEDYVKKLLELQQLQRDQRAAQGLIDESGVGGVNTVARGQTLAAAAVQSTVTERTAYELVDIDRQQLGVQRAMLARLTSIERHLGAGGLVSSIDEGLGNKSTSEAIFTGSVSR